MTLLTLTILSASSLIEAVMAEATAPNTAARASG